MAREVRSCLIICDLWSKQRRYGSPSPCSLLTEEVLPLIGQSYLQTPLCTHCGLPSITLTSLWLLTWWGRSLYFCVRDTLCVGDCHAISHGLAFFGDIGVAKPLWLTKYYMHIYIYICVCVCACVCAHVCVYVYGYIKGALNTGTRSSHHIFDVYF